MTIARVITSAVYESAAVDAKIISFEFNLYDAGEYVGGFSVGKKNVQAVHMATSDAWCGPLGAAYVTTMAPLVKAGTAIKTDLTLTEVSTSQTKTAAGVTRHTEYYKVDIAGGD